MEFSESVYDTYRRLVTRQDIGYEDIYDPQLDWLDAGHFDTIYWNATDEQGDPLPDNHLCIREGRTECFQQSEINYYAQGMFSASFGEPLWLAKLKAYSWKLSQYGEFPSDEVLVWIEWGYKSSKDLTSPLVICLYAWIPMLSIFQEVFLPDSITEPLAAVWGEEGAGLGKSERVDRCQQCFDSYGWQFYKEDARAYDLAVPSILSWHCHIKNGDKSAFLERARHHLVPDGKVIVCKNFLLFCRRLTPRNSGP